MTDIIVLIIVMTAVAGSIAPASRVILLMLILQGALLSAIALMTVLHAAAPLGYFAVVLTVAVKVIAIPSVIYTATTQLPQSNDLQLVLPRRLALAAALVLVLVAQYVTAPLIVGSRADLQQLLPSAVAVMLLGLFAMIIQRNALAQIMGLVMMENGLYLAALGATEGFPMVVELAIALDALVAAAVMTLLSRQIHRAFQTINTDRLRSLRG